MLQKSKWLVPLLATTSAWCDAAEIETKILAGADSLRDWTPAESEIKVATNKTSAAPVLHWHVPVDYFAGEVKYPVGWPRVSLPLKNDGLRDWSDWDFVEFNVLVESSRTNLPHEPVTLIIEAPNRSSASHHVLNELELGQWKQVRIPTAEVPLRSDVRAMQFSISESQYRHGDTLDLFIDRIALTRYSAPAIVNFAPESRLILSGARAVPLQVEVLGVRSGEEVELDFNLSRDGKLVASLHERIARGAQRVALPVKQLPAGDYVVTAAARGDRKPATTTLRVIASPYQ